MQPDIKSTAQAAANADQSEHEELLGIEREVHGEVCREHRGDSFLSLKPDREQPKHCGAADSREESSPVITNGEVHGGDLDAEENSTDRRGETRGDADGAGCRKHLAVSTLILVNALETGDQLWEESRHDTSDVHERTFLTEGHARTQGRGQTYHLLDIRDV